MMARPIEKVDCLIVGAGVVGLAISRALARRGREVLVCERGPAVGQGTTSRNSEVIHAGLYYKPGSLKARLCVEGRQALYRFCSERGVPHQQCGKLIVASTETQLPALKELHERAKACGVGDIRLVGKEEAGQMEPEVSCLQALLSPSTGIVDSHALTLALQGDAEAHGAVVSLRTPVHAAEALREGGIRVSVDGMDLHCRTVVNCAGLFAIDLARSVRGADPASLPEAFYAKGNYFRYSGSCSFRRLVYPLPEPNEAGLGVHATIDLAGQVRFGPDVEWVSRSTHERGGDSAEDDGFEYSVDPARARRFYEAIRRYWPAVEEGKLVPDYSGIRPKLTGPDGISGSHRGNRGNGGAADFEIQGPSVHGVKGLVNLLGIESPGLTSCLAISEFAANILEEQA